jgi:multiple antibiotic resistance protein
MTGLLSFSVLCFSSLFTIINPLSVAPVFVSMTEGASAAARRRAAVRACAVALGILLLFAVGGGLIFRVFGITIDAFRIAGGILFFAMSMRMLTGAGGTEGGEAAQGDPSVVPLGMPLICGPGAISTVMVLMGQSSSAKHVASLLLAIVSAILATALVLMVSPAVMRHLGKTGVELTTRVMGLIVCVIGIQFVIDGVRPVALEILGAAHGGR